MQAFVVAAGALAVFAGSPTLAAPLPQAAVFQPPYHAGGPAQCNDAYYEYLPGLVNFCMGVHDWESGRYQHGIGFLKLAAGWGSKDAQYMLGLAYYRGNHVAADPALGIAWLKLANERHDNKQIEVVTRSAIKHATPAQRQRAQQLFQKMRERYGDKVAATRAWKQFKHHSELLVDDEMSGGLAVSTTGGCFYLPSWQSNSMGRPLTPKALPPPRLRKTRPSSLLDGTCISSAQFSRAARALAHHYFRDWSGHVTVEPLQQLPDTSAPAH